MRIIRGEIPQEERWRVLALMAPGAAQDAAWRLGVTLARANAGQIVALILLEADASPADQNQAEETLARIEKAAVSEEIDAQSLIVEAAGL